MKREKQLEGRESRKLEKRSGILYCIIGEGSVKEIL